MSRDYVFVEDCAKANILALDKGEGQAINIGTGRPVKTRELLASLCSIMGKELKYTRAGPRPGDIRRSCLDVSKAAKVLGWKPGCDLDGGLARTVAFFSASSPAFAPAHG